MTKVRLHGTPEEVKQLTDFIESSSSCVKVLKRSEAYTDRGKSSYVRVYMDIELKTVEEILGDLETLKLNG